MRRYSEKEKKFQEKKEIKIISFFFFFSDLDNDKIDYVESMMRMKKLLQEDEDVDEEKKKISDNILEMLQGGSIMLSLIKLLT